MESMWNMLVPSEYLHGIHMEYIYSMDSIWNIFHHINKVFIHMDSMWIPIETQLEVKFSSQVDNFNLIQKV